MSMSNLTRKVDITLRLGPFAGAFKIDDRRPPSTKFYWMERIDTKVRLNTNTMKRILIVRYEGETATFEDGMPDYNGGDHDVTFDWFLDDNVHFTALSLSAIMFVPQREDNEGEIRFPRGLNRVPIKFDWDKPDSMTWPDFYRNFADGDT